MSNAIGSAIGTVLNAKCTAMGTGVEWAYCTTLMTTTCSAENSSYHNWCNLPPVGLHTFLSSFDDHHIIIWWSSYHHGRAHWCNYPPIEMHTLSSLSWLACVHLSDEKASDENASEADDDDGMVRIISLRMVKYHSHEWHACAFLMRRLLKQMNSLRMSKYHSWAQRSAESVSSIQTGEIFRFV